MQDVWGVLLGYWGLGGGERDLVVSIVGTMTWGCYEWIIIICVCAYVKVGYYSYAEDMLQIVSLLIFVSYLKQARYNVIVHIRPKHVVVFLLNLLTPWRRVLLEKLTGLQLVKKFSAFHGTRRFITALTSVRHLSLSWASPIQSIYPHSTSWRSILILSTQLLGVVGWIILGWISFPPVSPPRPYTPPSPHPYAPHAQPISFLSILSPAQYWVRSKNHELYKPDISLYSFVKGGRSKPGFSLFTPGIGTP